MGEFAHVQDGTRPEASAGQDRLAGQSVGGGPGMHKCQKRPNRVSKRPNTFCTTTRLNFFESAASLGELRVRVRLALERLEEEEEEEEEEETGMR